MDRLINKMTDVYPKQLQPLPFDHSHGYQAHNIPFHRSRYEIHSLVQQQTATSIVEPKSYFHSAAAAAGTFIIIVCPLESILNIMYKSKLYQVTNNHLPLPPYRKIPLGVQRVNCGAFYLESRSISIINLKRGLTLSERK